MLNIQDKQKCCGCSACISSCPKSCITLYEDEEGFLYPKINELICVDCGICEKVCPTSNKMTERTPLFTFAVKSKDEDIRLKSSSGGFFTILAEEIIRKNGVVFGAKFDSKWEVVHDYVKTTDGLSAFRGSKYLQSRAEETFAQTKKRLIEGEFVLYSGTPCQIAGLNLFLKKKYENLLTIDFVCHGVPSPKVWRTYLDDTILEICKKQNRSFDSQHFVKHISFRNKHLGWKSFSFILDLLEITRDGHEKILHHSVLFMDDFFMKGFLSNLYLRPSCYNCPAKKMKSGSDITIGDFWGIEKVLPDFSDEKGVSLVFLNSKKGLEYFQKLKLEKKESSYKDALRGNSSIEKSVQLTHKRTIFYKEFLQGRKLNSLIDELTYVSFIEKVAKKIVREIKKYI